MLFGYPITATIDNWLHECFYEVIQSIHNSLATGENIQDWSATIPIQYRDRLSSRLQGRGKLGDNLTNYQVALAKLSTKEQNQILQAFKDQNKIALLLSCQCNCEVITDLPLDVHEPVKTLFKYAFELLSDRNLEIRDKHYHQIYKYIRSHICPFCGDENLSSLGSQGSRREALDHYLLKDSYPFAAANLLNLVPMGYKCNSQYKNTKDLLYKNDGTRRRAFDPYSHHIIISISLDDSQPFAGIKGELTEPLPQWQIDFGLNSEETDTWNDVFYIKDRYSSILNDEFKSWLEFFCQWCKRRIDPKSDQALVDAIKIYADDRASEGFSDRAFLKAAVFKMLYVHCERGNQRLINFINDYVKVSSG
jgi:hypothetical protein